MIGLPPISGGRRGPIDTVVRVRQIDPETFELTVVKPEIKDFPQFREIVNRIRLCMAPGEKIEFSKEDYKITITTKWPDARARCLLTQGIRVIVPT